ncbi:TetR/AcrR family transcriptional regulator [Calditerricola satsumensis]|uniref:Transcriptional regulator n=1 Tax=Calditerricola satsumensis TaxID=373054 RepID=A0A8J3B2J6_9BACI|nr:TetR/AcrR family transcriptional regulator [Calditerricola satsumensis]GGJ91258.1 transcriptional regulator [Calditerricola satsumensis]
MAKRTGDKYQAIIDAAVRVIAKHGYHNAQVAKIAREANVADGTIYLYFRNKDDVLISVFREKMGEFIHATRARLDQVPTAEEKLRELIRMHLSQLAQNWDMAVVTQIELRQSNPVVRTEIRETLRQYYRLIEDVVRQGMAEGVFRRDVDVRTIRMMIFGTLDETATSWVMKKGKFDLLAQVDPIHRLLLSALRKSEQREEETA